MAVNPANTPRLGIEEEDAADLIEEAGEYMSGNPWLLLGQVRDALGKNGPDAAKHAKRTDPALDPKGDSWNNWLHRAKRGDLAGTRAAVEHVRKGGLVGIVPGVHGLAVLDVDEGDPLELMIQFFPIARAITRRGNHLYYGAPNPPCGNAKWELEGCRGEIRCGAGYVVVWDVKSLLRALQAAHKNGLLEHPLPPVLAERPKQPQQPDQRPRRSPSGSAPSHAALLATLGALDPTDYDDWLGVGMALHHAFGGRQEGLSWWTRWSAGAFTPAGKPPDSWGGREACTKKWSGFRQDGPSGGGDPITWGSIVKKARDARRNGEGSGEDRDRHPDDYEAEEAAAKRENALDEVRRLIANGEYEAARRELDALKSQSKAAETNIEDELAKAKSASALRKILNTLDPVGTLSSQTDWSGDVKPREWLSPVWFPAGRVVLLTAHGGSAKSLLALQMAVVVASGHGYPARGAKGPAMLPATKNASGKAPRLKGSAGVVVFVTWEDEPDEVRRRLSWLVDTTDGSPPNVVKDRLHVVDLAGRGALWGPEDGGHRDTVARLTETGAALEAYVRTVRPRLIVIDPVAAAFGGNENDRGAVRAWLSHLNALAADVGATVLLVAHPPKKQTDDHYSGSTDWRNGVRALLTLGPQTVSNYEYTPARAKNAKAAEAQALTLEKANYAGAGRRVWLRLRIVPGKGGRDGPPEKLYWEEATAWEAAAEFHKWKKRPAPQERKSAKKEEPNSVWIEPPPKEDLAAL